MFERHSRAPPRSVCRCTFQKQQRRARSAQTWRPGASQACLLPLMQSRLYGGAGRALAPGAKVTLRAFPPLCPPPVAFSSLQLSVCVCVFLCTGSQGERRQWWGGGEGGGERHAVGGAAVVSEAWGGRGTTMMLFSSCSGS